MSGAGDKPEIYIEFTQRGGLVKVTAIDSVTGTEATIFGPASTPREILTKNAVAKLAYVLKKNKGE